MIRRAAAVSLADYRTHVTMLKAAFTDVLTWSCMLKQAVAPGEQKVTINVTYILRWQGNDATKL
ncbi:hypothetical protein GJ11_01225 [Escherichia coli]|nr:hypothetical protein GJ11_01225 [Escherichia coli]